MKRSIFATIGLLICVIGIVCPPLVPLQAESPSVAANGNTLYSPEGEPLFLLGGNYVGGPDRSWTMWQNGLFDVNYVDLHFQRAKAAGLNTVRIFVRSPLQQEITGGNWNKLDSVVQLAGQHGLYLILTLHDYRDDDLARVAALDKAVASRYANNPTVLAYDLRNEPHYQDLAIAQYPGSPAPIQTDALIGHYGQRMTEQQADEWRRTGDGKSMVPAHYNSYEAYIYANNYRLYLDFLNEAGAWVAARNYDVSTLDYMDSPDSAKWQPLLQVLDQTLAAWLQPRIEAIRSADASKLITVGYSDLILAKLPANNALGLISIHRFPATSPGAIQGVFDLLDHFRAIYPDKPVILEEYGLSNDAADPAVTATYESALILHMLSRDMAGGAKWSLYNVAEGWNPREMNYGLYNVDGSPKPIVQVMNYLGEYTRQAHVPGTMAVDSGPQGSYLGYVYSAPNALFVSRRDYVDSDHRLEFHADNPAQVFVSWSSSNEINIMSTRAIRMTINPAAIFGLHSLRSVALQQVADGSPVSYDRQGNALAFDAAAGQKYRLSVSTGAVDARIEIVWPHDNLPVAQADKANIGAYLFDRDTGAALGPDATPRVRLWRALNNGVEEPVAYASVRAIQQNGLRFACFDFNDVDVSAANDENNKYYFSLSVDGSRYLSSIWSHGADARTYMPNQDVPTGVASAPSGLVDAKIEIVWPHGNLPVSEANQANIATYLFQRGTLTSVPVDWSPTVRLWRSLNNGFEEQVAVGSKVMKTVDGLTFPTWEFNNVDVSAATDPLNKYYFRVTVDGVNSRSNVWAHGADARTYFPQQDVPSEVVTWN